MDVGIEELRRQTKWFIDLDPTPITLIPVNKVKQPGGGIISVDQTPRAEQIFKMIHQSGVSDGVTKTQDGVQRKFEYVLVGEYDAEIAIGDKWQDGDQLYEITGIHPFNGYEVKAGVSSMGATPNYG